LYAMKGSGAVAAEALDALRQQDIPEGGKITGEISQFDPLSFCVGRVVRAFGRSPEASSQCDLTKYIDREHQTVKSLTGELSWNYGTGIVLVDTPRSQGAAGFLSKGGKIALSDVIIESRNEFSSILVISLDDQPLKISKRILVQAITQEQPYGFKVEGDRITDLGSAPFGVQKIDAKVSLQLAGEGTPTVQALDANGYATEKVVSANGDGGNAPLTIWLSENAIYHLIQR